MTISGVVIIDFEHISRRFLALLLLTLNKYLLTRNDRRNVIYPTLVLQNFCGLTRESISEEMQKQEAKKIKEILTAFFQ